MNFGDALQAGYSAAEMIGFISGNYPNIAKRITQARKTGYDMKKIVEFFKGMTPQDLEKYENSTGLSSSNPLIEAEKSFKKTSAQEQAKRGLKTGLRIAAPVVAFAAFRNLAPAVAPFMQGFQSPDDPKQIGYTPEQEVAEQAQGPIQLGMEPRDQQSSLNQEEPPPEVPPEEPTQEPGMQLTDEQRRALPFLEKRGLLDKLSKYVGKGKTKQEAIEYLKKKLPMMDQEYLRTFGVSGEREGLDAALEKLVDPFFPQEGGQVEKIEESVEEVQAPRIEVPSEEQDKEKEAKAEEAQEVTQYDPKPIEKPEQVEKGETVITDTGVGTVKSKSGRHFLVEENGKVKKIPLEELRAEPEAIKNAEIVIDPRNIPENMRSAALGMAIPMPDRSSIITMFGPSKDFYVYRRKDGKALDDEIVQRIIEGVDTPMTKGDTFMGSWDPDVGDSRGSASYKELVKMAQKAGDPDDPSKPLIFEKIEDSFVHGFIGEFLDTLKEAGKQFGAKKKKKK